MVAVGSRVGEGGSRIGVAVIVIVVVPGVRAGGAVGVVSRHQPQGMRQPPWAVWSIDWI